jgi:hypothetical protein
MGEKIHYWFTVFCLLFVIVWSEDNFDLDTSIRGNKLSV